MPVDLLCENHEALTDFVGREAQLSEVADLVAAHPLVTLVVAGAIWDNAPGARSNWVQTTFAMVVHDLRQPLQVILGTHELLAQQLAVGPGCEQLERSDRATTQLSQRQTY